MHFQWIFNERNRYPAQDLLALYVILASLYWYEVLDSFMRYVVIKIVFYLKNNLSFHYLPYEYIGYCAMDEY